ncbi:hypothetical protein [Rahnella bonaserana]|jgi:type 1 fimbria pilin
MKRSILSLLLAGGVIAGQFSGSAHAEQLNYSGSVTIEKGSCVFTALDNMRMEFNFASVTPLQVLNAATSLENTFQVKDCAGASGIDLSLTTTTSQVLTGAYAGKWTIPASGTGKAVGLAYKTELKSGGGAYASFPVDGTAISITTNSVALPISIKTTLVPTVSSLSAMTSGNMDAAAIINIAYQ